MGEHIRVWVDECGMLIPMCCPDGSTWEVTDDGHLVISDEEDTECARWRDWTGVEWAEDNDDDGDGGEELDEPLNEIDLATNSEITGQIIDMAEYRESRIAARAGPPALPDESSEIQEDWDDGDFKKNPTDEPPQIAVL
jgi:hypothetical protein